MKKTLLATAIAGALGASAAAQAATVYNQDGTQLDIYGNIQLAYAMTDNANGDSEDQIEDNGSTIGFTGQHVINPGLTGYFKAEFEHDADEAKEENGLDTGDQAYLGMKGNFGDVRLGSWDALIDDWVQDPVSNNEYFDLTDSNGLVAGDDGVNTQNSSDDREGDKIQYLSPSFNGLQFAVGSQYKGDAEGENESNSGNASFFGGAKYTMGAFSVAAVYDNLANYDGDVSGNSYLVEGVDEETGEAILVEGGDEFDAGDQFGVTFEYTLDALSLAAKYERYESGDSDLIADQNRYGLGARYGYGFGDVYGQYQYVDVGGSDFGDTFSDAVNEGDLPNDTSDESYNEVVIGATYNITSSFYTFAEAAFYDRENDEGDGFAVGATYAF